MLTHVQAFAERALSRNLMSAKIISRRCFRATSDHMVAAPTGGTLGTSILPQTEKGLDRRPPSSNSVECLRHLSWPGGGSGWGRRRGELLITRPCISHAPQFYHSRQFASTESRVVRSLYGYTHGWARKTAYCPLLINKNVIIPVKLEFKRRTPPVSAPTSHSH
jgi:hypothetical protein